MCLHSRHSHPTTKMWIFQIFIACPKWSTQELHFDQWEFKCLQVPCELWEPFSSKFPNDSWLNLVVSTLYKCTFFQRLKGAWGRFLELFSISPLPFQNSALNFQLPQSPWTPICSLNSRRPLCFAWDFPACTTLWNNL